MGRLNRFRCRINRPQIKPLQRGLFFCLFRLFNGLFPVLLTLACSAVPPLFLARFWPVVRVLLCLLFPVLSGVLCGLLSCSLARSPLCLLWGFLWPVLACFDVLSCCALLMLRKRWNPAKNRTTLQTNNASVGCSSALLFDSLSASFFCFPFWLSVLPIFGLFGRVCAEHVYILCRLSSDI